MLNKFKISRRGRKLQTSDDPRTLLAMPKDVPERTWAEILQREDNELVCLDLREEILDNALQIGYEFYMERQTAPFLVFCAAEAWLKLIDWHFYRHDPGEDPSALPLCFIPRRIESWKPDTLPQPSPKDTWGIQELEVLEKCPIDFTPVDREPSSDSMVVLPEIQPQFWFPGKVNLTTVYETKDGVVKVHNIEKDGPRPDVELMNRDEQWKFIQVEAVADEESEKLGTESEVLQKVVDYAEEQTPGESSQGQLGSPHPPSLVEGSLRGAGDSVEPSQDKFTLRPKSIDAWSGRHGGRSAYSRLQYPGMRQLPPMGGIASPSVISGISDCRLRNHRLETNFEISTEKFDPMQSRSQKRPYKKHVCRVIPIDDYYYTCRQPSCGAIFNEYTLDPEN